MRNTVLFVGAAGFIACALPVAAASQAHADSGAHRANCRLAEQVLLRPAPHFDARLRNDCRLAHQVLTHGRPANRTEWALGMIDNCPAHAGEALAAHLRRFRGESAPSPALERFVSRAALVQDGFLFSAALQLAADPSAGAEARIQAIRIVHHQLYPGTFLAYEAFVTDPLESGTVDLPSTTTGGAVQGAPLPSDKFARVEAALRPLLQAGVSSPQLRRALEFLLGSVEYRSTKERLCAGVPEEECDRRMEEWIASVEEDW